MSLASGCNAVASPLVLPLSLLNRCFSHVKGQSNQEKPYRPEGLQDPITEEDLFWFFALISGCSERIPLQGCDEGGNKELQQDRGIRLGSRWQMLGPLESPEAVGECGDCCCHRAGKAQVVGTV